MKEKIEKLKKKIEKVWKSKKNDPNGSYTGKATDGGKPIQDQDDL